MVILLVPHLGCQARCAYCFAENRPVQMETDVNAMKNCLWRLENEPRFKGSYIGIHGGEASLAKRKDIDALAECAHWFCDSPHFQTNGIAIDSQLVETFCTYNMSVGVSIDGPGILNSLRGPDPSSRAVTTKYTARVSRNLKALGNTGLNLSVMSILHEANVGTPERLEKFENWLLKLREWGVNSARLNLMYATNESAKQYELTAPKAIGAWIALYEFHKLHQLRLDPFMEMIRNLKGEEIAPCVYAQCDFYSTHTISILPDGTVGNCDRTFGYGYYLHSDRSSHPGRYAALQLSQCKGCRYWNVCHGGCPMEGIDNDWRNKSRHCPAIFNLYEWIERDLTSLFDKVNLNER